MNQTQQIPKALSSDPACNQRLEQRIKFLSEIEKLKMIYRQNVVIDGSRQENSAEHSWHIAIMAILLAEFADAPNLNMFKVVKMLLIHDIVEIDNGDVFLYDKKGNENKLENETAAAERIFGILPTEDFEEFKSLWIEFETRETPEAKYAAAIDGMQPLLNHYLSNGIGIKKHNVKTSQVIDSKKHIDESSKSLWTYSKLIIEKSEEMGLYLK